MVKHNLLLLKGFDAFGILGSDSASCVDSLKFEVLKTLFLKFGLFCFHDPS